MEPGLERVLYSIDTNLNRIANSLENLVGIVQATTPEEIAALAPAIAAVKRGFADLERAVREENDGNSG